MPVDHANAMDAKKNAILTTIEFIDIQYFWIGNVTNVTY